MGGDRRGSRRQVDFAGPVDYGGEASETGWRAMLHEQLEEILGEVWRQEAWAQTEARIDAVLAKVPSPSR